MGGLYYAPHLAVFTLLLLWQLCGSRKILHILMMVFSSIWLCLLVYIDLALLPRGLRDWSRNRADQKGFCVCMILEHAFALWILILASINMCCSKKKEDSSDMESPPVVGGFTPVNINAGFISRRQSVRRSSYAAPASPSPRRPSQDYIVLGKRRK